MKQPEALRLAEQLRDLSTMFKTPSHEKGVCNGASFEIRRLHEANQAMLEALRVCKPYIEEHARLFFKNGSSFACKAIDAAIAKGEL